MKKILLLIFVLISGLLYSQRQDPMYSITDTTTLFTRVLPKYSLIKDRSQPKLYQVMQTCNIGDKLSNVTKVEIEVDFDTLKANIITTNDSSEITFLDDIRCDSSVNITKNLTIGDTIFYDSDTVTGVIRLDSITGDIGNSTTGISVLYADTIYQGGVTIIRIKIAIDDDVTYNLPDASNINLEVTQAANFAKYIIITDGTVAMPITLNSTDDADTDGVTICVYDTGTQAVLKNRSGGTLTYIVHYEY